MTEHKFEAGSPDAIAEAATKANYKGEIPREWLSYKVGEYIRIKGWIFRIEKATKSGRLVVQALAQGEVEKIAADAIVRIKRKQIANSAEQAEKRSEEHT